MTKLDLNKLPEITNSTGLLKYNPFQEFPELINLGEVSERIYGCSLFNYGEKDEKYPNFSEKAHLRAALNELVSISEMLKKLHNNITIENSNLPILHFFKELRVTNFHLKTFNPTHIKGTFLVYNSTTGIINPNHYEAEHYIINDCNTTLFADNNNFLKHYNTQEFITTIEWVNHHQRIWGISHIIEAALRQYCLLIKNTVTNIKK